MAVYDESIPGLAILLRLGLEVSREVIKTIRRHASDMFHLAGSALEGYGEGDTRHEVDVGDVGVELVGVEGELTKTEIDVRVRVAGVEHARFY